MSGVVDYIALNGPTVEAIWIFSVNRTLQLSSVIVPGEMEASVFFRKGDSDAESVEESVSLSLASRNIQFISYSKVHVIYVPLCILYTSC